MIETIIIDDRKIERDKVASLLSAREDIRVLAQGKDSYDALRLAGKLRPDIAVLSGRLESIEREDIPPLIKARSPSTAVVIMFEKASDYQIWKALVNKVSGVVQKETDMEILPDVLRCVAEGGCFISPWITARAIHIFMESNRKKPPVSGLPAENPAGDFDNENMYPDRDPVAYLSKMELRILTRVGEGRDSKEIADAMNLTAGTVRNHISAIMRKSGLRNRSQMAGYAFFYGLVPAKAAPLNAGTDSPPIISLERAGRFTRSGKSTE